MAEEGREGGREGERGEREGEMNYCSVQEVQFIRVYMYNYYMVITTLHILGYAL